MQKGFPERRSTVKRRGDEGHISLSSLCFQNPCQHATTLQENSRAQSGEVPKWQGFLLSASEAVASEVATSVANTKTKSTRLWKWLLAAYGPITSHHACVSSPRVQTQFSLMWFTFPYCHSLYVLQEVFKIKRKPFPGVGLALLHIMNWSPYTYNPSLPTFTSLGDPLSLISVWKKHCSYFGQMVDVIQNY